MDDRDKTVLVTGGCGFIGSALVPQLLKQGYTVRVLDNMSVGSAEDLSDYAVEIMVGDIRDKEAVSKAVAGADGVVHLAAQTGVIDSINAPEVDFEINAAGVLNMLLACREYKVPRFVFASSNAPIGENEPPVDETKPARPLSPYGASKLAGEGYCSAFNGSYGVGTVVLRFANAYGPRSTHKGSVVAKFLKDAASTGKLTIYGDGMQTRDFVHTTDLCGALIAALQSDVGGETFQIATGIETTVLYLAQMVQREFPDIEIVHEGQRAGEIIKNYSNIEKAQTILKWDPQVTLADGLAETIHWFQTEYNK